MVQVINHGDLVFHHAMHGSKLNGELNRAHQLVTKARGFKNEAARACGSSVTEGIGSETDRWVLSRRGGYAAHQVSLREPRLILARIAARAMAQGRRFRWCGHWVLCNRGWTAALRRLQSSSVNPREDPWLSVAKGASTASLPRRSWSPAPSRLACPSSARDHAGHSNLAMPALAQLCH